MNNTVCIDFFEHHISGNIFSDLAESKQLFANDLFLVTRVDDRISSSYAIAYSTLSNAVLLDWNNNLSVKSMAYEDTWKYAEINHVHDGIYNSISAKQISLAADDKVCIAVLSTSSMAEPLSIYAPIIVSEDLPEYEIGTLRFVCNQNMHAKFTNDDLSSNDFDGWVYADGTIFTPRDKTRYQKALEIYGVEHNAESFRVPNIADFIKCSPFPVSEIGNIRQQQLGIAVHTHQIDQITFDGDLRLKKDFTFKTYDSSGGSVEAYRSNIHNGVNRNISVRKADFKFDLQQVQFDLSCSHYGTQNQKFEPRHNTIPVMVYIGGVKY